MNTCATCKRWERTNEDDHGSLATLGVGKCQATPMFWDSTEWRKDSDGRVLMREFAGTTAFVQDGSDYLAILYTMPSHCCTMHEVK